MNKEINQDNSKLEIALEISSSTRSIPTVFTNTNLINQKNTNAIQAEKLFTSGLEFFNEKNIDDAIKCFKAAITIDATIGKYHSYLGLAVSKKGWIGYAQAEYKVSLFYDPADKIALDNYIVSSNGTVKQIKNNQASDTNKKSFFSTIKQIFS